MILDEFLNRLKAEYHTLDAVTPGNYYQRISSLFVVLELDGDSLNQEHDLGIDNLLDKFNEINENQLQKDLSQADLNVLLLKLKAGLAIMINKIEE